MRKVPARMLLSDQVADILREGISEGRWKSELPSESVLCRDLRISRTTLRKALALLVDANYIREGGRGRHHGILYQGPQAETSSGYIIRVLCPYPKHELNMDTNVSLEIMAEYISEHGYALEYEYNKSVFVRNQPQVLEGLNALPDTAAWVLLYYNKMVLDWFVGCGRPCLCLGSPIEGIALPFIYNDALATGRHAAGIFFSRGHREMVYFIANVTSRTDRLCANAFVDEATRLGASASIVEYEPERDAIRKRLDGLFSRGSPPTALMCSCPEHCLTILCHLIGKGIRIPGDVSLVIAEQNVLLNYTVPAITHYYSDAKKTGKYAGEVLLKMLRNRSQRKLSKAFLQEFVDAGSLGPPPTAALLSP